MIVAGLLSITYTSSDTGSWFWQQSVKWSSWCIDRGCLKLTCALLTQAKASGLP